MTATISDSERREVARKLRELSETESVASFLEDDVRNDMVLRAIRAVVGKGDVFERLADLIEPERETTMDVSESYGEFECEVCGCRVDDVTAVDNGAICFCPDCGAEVVA